MFDPWSRLKSLWISWQMSTHGNVWLATEGVLVQDNQNQLPLFALSNPLQTHLPHSTPPTTSQPAGQIAIQNQSQGVTCASVWPFLYLLGNSMREAQIKKSNDVSGLYRCTWGPIERLGSQNELGRADLRGSRLRGGHIQSHLTHSALTFEPWQQCPCVNSHLRGSIALDHRLGPLAGAPGMMEGAHGEVHVGRRAVRDGWPRRAGPLTNDDVGNSYWNWIWWGGERANASVEYIKAQQFSAWTLKFRLKHPNRIWNSKWVKSPQAPQSIYVIHLSTPQTWSPHFDP